jgi:serine/threonine protein kinase
LLQLQDPANPILKVGDFGLAKKLEPPYTTSSLCGSPIYTAPEVWREVEYSAKVDVWSAGVVLYKMLFGKTPWQTATKELAIEDLRKLSGQQIGIHLDSIHNLLRRNS